MFRTWIASRVGLVERMRAASPLTTGAENEVPCRRPKAWSGVFSVTRASISGNEW